MTDAFDFDWLVVGSGFGGSVAALRLAEKCYRVGVLEAGRRFADTDFAERAGQLRRYYFLPALGLHGIFRPTLFKDVFVVTGAGVGGGSLTYANTLYRSRPRFATNPQWAHLADWDGELAPHYEIAERMLGVTTYDEDGEADSLLHEYAYEHGFADTYARSRVGVFLGRPGETVPDPYFAGAGPERTGCIRCGGCLLGCRHNAKNTLVKNYLWFAERRGTRIMAERTVIDIRPRGSADGADGYTVTTERTGRWLRRKRRRHTARGVVIAAGALGTNRLLLRCKLSGALPGLSDRIGQLVRTNSESIIAITAPDDTNDFARGLALTSGAYPVPDTHIQPVTYGSGGDAMSLLTTLAMPRGTRLTRPFLFAANIIRHPTRFARASRIRHASRRSMLLTTMRSVEDSLALRVRFRLPTGYPVLTTEQDPEHPIPRHIPAAYAAAEWIAEKIGGVVQAAIPEALLSIPTTAHLLGGAVIGESEDRGVVNARHEVFGYRNLLVCDGAAVPANVGVNPSLTITAMAERAMSFIPVAPGATQAPPIRFSRDTHAGKGV
ncbi:GMC family oxidoreductase [Nocardia arthritidis]|uniref:Cholesterol oxidase n=1 Tax=Nocardia arthritidis TaxID=228602 RepID=A0A6G9YLQ1_9NOCA|nr:GMC family oxidoreductase [Nocardia arthritidis]QIS14111.1 FAD-dependent oxidoreductase [Nocardia arthritidis]